MQNKIDTRLPMSTYERIMPFKSIPYWLFWLGIGVLAFISTEIMVRVYEEDEILNFPALRIIMAIIWAGFPITLTWLSHRFYETLQFASDAFWNDPVEAAEWLQKRHKRIFTFQSGYSKLIAFFIGVSVTLSYSLGGIPIENLVPKIYFLITGTLVAFMGGQTAYIVIDLLVTLTELTRRNVQIPFFRLPHPRITRLQNYYAISALIMTAGYILLIIAGWQSPYGLSNPGVITWLSLLAFFPLALFIWSSTLIHTLVTRVKESFLELVNKQVQTLFQKTEEIPDIKTYDQLEKAMNLQVKIQSLPEWPFSFASIFTFLITLSTAVIQVIIPLLNVLNP